MKTPYLLLASVIAGAIGGAVVVGLLRPAAPVDDACEAYLSKNLAEVERQVFADVDRYGADIYRLFIDISKMMPGRPEDDFGGDKAMRKLVTTYPDSNVRRLAEAFVVYGAVRLRDMLKIERYLEELERRPAGSPVQLMPTGFEIEPQLVLAQYSYFFQTGKMGEAAKALEYLDSRFHDSWLCQPPLKPVRVADYARVQRRVLAADKEKGGKGR